MYYPYYLGYNSHFNQINSFNLVCHFFKTKTTVTWIKKKIALQHKVNNPYMTFILTNICITRRLSNLFWAIRLSFPLWLKPAGIPGNNNWHFIMPFTVTEILHLWMHSIQYVNQITCLSVQIKEPVQICVRETPRSCFMKATAGKINRNKHPILFFLIHTITYREHF